jgi:hypothetical protein
MRRVLGLAVLAVVACKPALTPTEQAAKDRSECMVVALDQTGFDPVTAEEPPRTVSSTHERGGTLEEGAGSVAEGAVGGAIMADAGKGAAAGAAAGGLIGGAKHYQESHEMVPTTRPNPEYQQYVANKAAYKSALDGCLAARAGAPK